MKLLKKILIKVITIISSIYCNKNGTNGNIIIISFKFLGDTVFTIPAIRFIKKIIPNHKILILCYESNKQIYELEFNDVEYLVFDKGELDLENRKFNLKFIRALKDINNFKPQYLFDFTSNYKTALLGFLSRIKLRYGFGNQFLRGFYSIFNMKAPISGFDIFLNLVRCIDQNASYKDCLEFRINYSIKEKILFMPSAGWSAKEWTKNNFFNLVNRISQFYKTKIVTESNFFSDELCDFINKSNIDYVQSHNIQELIKEINSSSIIVSNDTGPIYLSALLGHPTYTIFGPTGPLFHKIEGDHHQFIRKELKCSPTLSEKLCFAFGGRIGCPSNECMQLLSVNEVYNDLILFLDLMNISKHK
jgi:heptosyltransferase II